MSTASKPPRENLMLSLGLNVLLPSVLLGWGKDWFGLEPVPLLIIALLFPFGYGIYDLIRRKKWSIFTTIGIVSVAITGGIGVFKLPKEWVAWNETLPPALFSLAIFLSAFTRKSLVGAILYNPDIFDVDKISVALNERGNTQRFQKLLTQCTLLMAAATMIAAVLNFALAKYMIQSESGTDAFNSELGKMKAWSFPCITLPAMILSYLPLHLLLKGIKKLAGLELEDVMLVNEPPEKGSPPST